jgi:hypothetical protein
MRKLFRTKRRIAVTVGTVALAAAMGGAAFAYFTATGSGTGTAKVGTAGKYITVTGTETTPLVPGGAGGTVSFTASNSSTLTQELNKISLVSIAPDSGHATCSTVLGTDFSMADVTVGADGVLAGSASNVGLSETGTLYMLDSGVNQDACQGATLTLTFSTS